MSIKIENVDVYGWETAIRGMRNPMNSWDKIESKICEEWDCAKCPFGDVDCSHIGEYDYVVGANDLDLMKRLFKGGTEHRKYLRFINVTMDITAPLYWWKEFDTYKIGTNCNSCSTMHKIHAKEFTLDDFSCEHLFNDGDRKFLKDFEYTVHALNLAREQYLKTKDKIYWWQMIQLLPSSYNQRRTVQMSYEVAVRMIQQRKNHKLDEWHDMVDVLMDLPYMKEIMGCE